MVGLIGNVNAPALQRGEHRHGSHLPEALLRARRQIETSRVRAIDDVEVVVAGKRHDEWREAWKRGERVEQLAPFRGRACVGQITGDDDCVEWLATMHLVESS